MIWEKRGCFMKKSPLVLSIISLLITLVAGVLFVFLPKMAFGGLEFAPTWNNGEVLTGSRAWVDRFVNNIWPALQTTFTLKGPYMVYDIILIVLTVAWAVFLVVPFIVFAMSMKSFRGMRCTIPPPLMLR